MTRHGVLAVAVAAVATAGLAGCSGTAVPIASRTVAPHATASTAQVASGPATFQGPDGVEARWVVQENSRPGSTAWKITHATGSIDGFASQVYAQQGQQVTLYVSTAAATFRAQAFRMGYYQGTGARLVWQSGATAARSQPGCPVTAGTNMVACDNWSPSLTFTVTSAFVQGDYLIKLTGSGGQQSYVPITIWDPASTATYLVKNDVFTWQAWNPYGGYDFYAGPGSCPPNVYPLCTRARVVSFDRPYGAEQGSGNFLSLEYPLVYWMEQHGLDVTYVTDLTVDQHPSVTMRHRVLLSLGHDECWSLSERQAAVAAHSTGMNIVFFAASPVLRHVRVQNSPLGPGREVVDYRDSQDDPLDGKGSPLQVTGNTWAAAPANWPEDSFVGESYAGFLEPGLHTAMVVADASGWIFAGTGLHNGSKVYGVIASDVDHYYAPLDPSNVQLFTHSPIDPKLGQTDLGPFFSDISYYTDAKTGAGVVDLGTNNWIPAMTDDNDGCADRHNCAHQIVQEITGNIMRVLGMGPPGRTEPSVGNARQVTGQ